MPLIFILPAAAGVLGFGAGWFSNDKYSWVKWVAIAALGYMMLKKKGMV
ncbi:hypothetical protein [Marinomonas fungiae]